MRGSRGIVKRRRIGSRLRSEMGSDGSTFFFAPERGRPEQGSAYILFLQRVDLAEHNGKDGAKNEGDSEGHRDGRDVELRGEGRGEAAFVERFF